MKNNSLVIILIFAAIFLVSLNAEETVPSIETDGDWTKVQFMTMDKLKIDYVWMKDGSVVVSIYHIFDRKTEKPVTFSDQLDVDGLKIEDLSNPPMQIGYRYGNLEFSQSICRVIVLDPKAEMAYLPKSVFSHTPEYWPFVLPYPIELPKKD
tara:strand:- start:184 stop:639 length:456 start_codon:yes stop_codon:yes gene_type:complete